MHCAFTGQPLLRTSQAARCCAFISGAEISRSLCGAFAVTCSNAKKNHKRAEKIARKQASQPTPTGAAKTPPPQRITPDSKGNISIKRAKVYVQRRVDRQNPSFRQIQPSYRKTPLTEEERLEAQQEREAQALSRKQQKAVVTLTKFYGTLGFGSAPVVLVDAHNVLGAILWARNLTRAAAQRQLRRKRAAYAAGLELMPDNVPDMDPVTHQMSREMLQDRLAAYSSATQMRVVVVWDALGGPSPVITREKRHGIDIVFCGDSEADTFLMKEVAGLKAAGAREVIVVTSDGFLRDCIGAAHVIKASSLIRELDKTDEATNRFMKEQEVQSLLPTGSIGGALNQNTFQQLQALQQQLPSKLRYHAPNSSKNLSKRPRPPPSSDLAGGADSSTSGADSSTGEHDSSTGRTDSSTGGNGSYGTSCYNGVDSSSSAPKNDNCS